MPGALLIVAALMVGVYAIVEASNYGWGSAHTLGFGAGAVALLAAFVVREARAAQPAGAAAASSARATSRARTRSRH